MKQVKIALFAIVAGFAMVACNSVDSKIDKFEKACKDGDQEKMMEIIEDLDEADKEGKVSMEQKQRVAKITADCLGLGNALGTMMDIMGE